VALFRASVTPGHPCGTIKVFARVIHAVRGTTFSASAVAKFTGGDVTIQLRRAGKSYVALGKINVPAGYPTGTSVNVEVTISYGGVAQSKITRVATIQGP
jgi:hypothetical protein